MKAKILILLILQYFSEIAHIVNAIKTVYMYAPQHLLLFYSRFNSVIK